MIHELNNETMLNHWENRTPQPDDWMIVYKEGQFLLCEQEDEIQFPRAVWFDQKKCIYLFTINNEGFFYFTDSNIPEIETAFWSSVQFFRERKMKKAYCFAGITAYHLCEWYKNSQFCGRCGNKTVHSKKERMMECPHCGNMIFPRISPAVIVAVTDKNKLLMSKYAGRANSKYILLAGFCEIGETLEETCKREVLEETGVHIKNIRYYKSQPWGLSGTLLSGFFAEANSEEAITVDTAELSEACWIDREDIHAVNEDFSLTNDMIMAFKQNKF